MKLMDSGGLFNLIYTTNKSELHNVGNPDRKELIIMPQIIACEWGVRFSENLLHKTVYPLKDPWLEQKQEWCHCHTDCRHTSHAQPQYGVGGNITIYLFQQQSRNDGVV